MSLSFRVAAEVKTCLEFLSDPISYKSQSDLSSNFEPHDPDLQIKTARLESLLKFFNTNSRQLLDLYHFRVFSAYDVVPTGYSHMVNLETQTLRMRRLMKEKNRLVVTLPVENEKISNLRKMDQEADFFAKYKGRINALEVFLRSELGLMLVDIHRAGRMTKEGEFSSGETPDVQNEKIERLEFLLSSLEQLDRSKSNESGLAILPGQRATLLNHLKSDGDSLVRRLRFRFKLDEETSAILLEGWALIFQRKARRIDSTYLDREKIYQSWPHI